MTTYSPEETTTIFEAINSILMGNNGYADLPGFPQHLVPALRDAGFVVIHTHNTHGTMILRGFTKMAQEALKNATHGRHAY